MVFFFLDKLLCTYIIIFALFFLPYNLFLVDNIRRIYILINWMSSAQNQSDCNICSHECTTIPSGRHKFTNHALAHVSTHDPPVSSSSLATSRFPSMHAKCNGVICSSSRLLKSAPASTRQLATAREPWLAAQWRGVILVLSLAC